MVKKYVLDKTAFEKRFKRIFLTSTIRFGFAAGILTCFGSFSNFRPVNRLDIILEEESTIDYSYLDLDSYEGKNIEEKYLNFKKEEDINIQKALDYFASEQYQIDLVNGNAFYKSFDEQISISNSFEYLNKEKQDYVDDSVYYDDNYTISFEQMVIKHYADIYQVDYDSVYKKLSEMTNGFTSEEYLNGFIPGVTFKGEESSFNNLEALLLVAVRCCAQKPGDFGLGNIKNNYQYSSTFSSIQEIIYYSNLFGVNPALAIGVYLAEGNQTNNVGSIKVDGVFANYGNQTQGVIEMVAELYKFVSRGLDTPDAIQPIYAPLDDGELNANWLTNVYDGMWKSEQIIQDLEPIDYGFDAYKKVAEEGTIKF